MEAFSCPLCSGITDIKDIKAMKGKTLIGTCGGCSSDIVCPIQDLLRDKYDNYFGDFGCIHWEEKP